MKHENTPTWLSAHLYYNEPWEQFLTQAVFPFADIVTQTGIAESYFFIRYWERGPHIRLRFKLESEKVKSIFEPSLEEHFKNYFESRPSLRTEPNYPPRFPQAYKWYPNNSFRFETYRPELKRYGGEIGVAIAEQQFQASSKIVLDSMLEKSSRWTYDDALGLAIKLHLSFAHAVGMTREDASRFFESYFNNWLPHAYQLNPKKKSEEEKALLKLEKVRAFNDAYVLQKRNLQAYHKALWTALDQEESFEEAMFHDWIATNKDVASQLKSAQQEGKLTQRSQNFRYTFTEGIITNFELWEHYADYIHMTNNRLGVLNQDEGYLGFLMMKCMNEMDQLEDDGDEVPPEANFFLSF